MLPNSDLLLLLLICASLGTPTSQAQEYLKLRLLRRTPLPSGRQALALDSLRLSSSSSTTTTSSSVPIVSGASSGAGQYFVDLRIGTPPQRIRLVADTGSDLVWARCSPCRGPGCSARHPPGSAFLPRLSSSFAPFHCYDPSCRLVPHPRHSPRCPRSRLHSPCRFRYSYADRSSAAGFFSRETATLNASSGRAARLPALPFGCAFNVSTGPSIGAARGVLGLGRGPISFPYHAAPRFGATFSYCLPDYTLSPPPTSYLLIGAAPRHRHQNLSFTPLLSNPLSPTFYYIRILSASIDATPLPIDPSVWALDPASGAGGTVIDTGTTLSFLPAPAYLQILRAVAKRLPRAALAGSPPGFDLCVNASAEGLRLPRLAFRLLGGAELSPPPANYFIDTAEGVRCLALQPVSPTGPGFGVIGNLMQQGFLFVFDLDRAASRLAFSRTGCID
ncbi:aspartic proteinase NANA, chloroplast-like [Phoenix dactylifera]|uniref:Aspartic proteinase NANA, chloroplast-like n=1 Tax=Phoenix dactylifera TaxID=42345 RepID=A0A8B8ZY56_PHODC|nr:aspartic proteinase NANA, chloroplast-like [Phoenix dactylifera]